MITVSYTHLIHDEDGHKEQSLIAGLEILQQTLCLTAVGGKIGRDDVHLVAGADCPFLLFDLHLVKVGDLRFDALDCLRLVNRPDMKIDRDRSEEHTSELQSQR